MKWMAVFSLAILVGCAQIHSGNKAFRVDASGNPIMNDIGKNIQSDDLIVSGLENQTLSSRNFGLIDFTFENTTDRWIRIESIKVYFKEKRANQNIVFTSGKDLSIWFKATQKKLLIEQQNNQMAMAVIAGLGAGLAIGSDNKNVQNLGTAMVGAAGLSLSIDAINRQLNKIQSAGIFPEDHLYSGDFFIPPGLFTKKWILLNSTNHFQTGYLKEIYIDYKPNHGRERTLKLRFRPGLTIPHGWQGDVGPNNIRLNTLK